ncbi:fatty acid cis/trans isomerase [Sulfurimonas gotlandica GD1]|uniref:Fatty acid cis/trans isomerase n=1 Tax=Sulfurimonas gotlandica (strain DSM 19862 / JCM 16533 / GD1) TaxID=929558 RepID=B6BL84_SULGG|nr:fatty acid cis/trans isomerase [Sulfurimonas gotlandica]EDZ62207.1 fatty acid cis/trans isomerase [Sulfurimonas gotlandica GD1]EHP28537.1 fatty acid cis/trans isomerase [Sulfurimonas gotlandica GD1]
MRNYLFFIPFILSVFSGCSVEPLKPVEVTAPQARIDYLKEVKPILDKRCVVCHSCYNSPCQLKLSSFEGIDRGASKDKVYLAERLLAQDPSRLFIDAKNTKEWREKDFNSVLDSDAQMGSNNSMMLLLLDHKMRNPKSEGDYFSESDDLTCSKNREELAEFLDDNPHQGMPFGFPPLSKDEFKTIKEWLGQGAPAPSASEITPSKVASKVAQKDIEEFEIFLNNPDAKHVMSARYIYEHLFWRISHLKAHQMNFLS